MSANQGKKINTYPDIETLNDESTFVVLQKIDGVLKLKQLPKEKFIEQFNEPIVVTYAEILALVNAGNLQINKAYNITNAFGNTLNLIVFAVNSSILNEVAISKTNGENYIYDVVTDQAYQTSNEIKFTIADPSETSVLSYDDANVSWVNKEVNDILPQSLETDTNLEVLTLKINNGSELDSYEEGIWTPTANNISFSSAVGSYTRIGDMVYFTAFVVIGVTSDTSEFQIKNLPFVCTTNDSYGAFPTLFTATLGNKTFQVGDGTTILRGWDGSSLFVNSDVSNSSIRVSGFYKTI